MLQVERLGIRYGAVEAVDNLTFHVPDSTCVALIGSNGAGKSSVLKGIMGLASATGSIRLGNTDLGGLKSHQRVSAGIALSPEGRHVFADMSVKENLLVGAAGHDREALVTEMFGLFPRLGEREKQIAGSMSGGEQQMLAIARALMSKPKLLMLDEPTMGLAPIIVDQVIVLINVLKKRGLSILLAEQNAEMALEVAEHAYVLETGRLKREGASADLARDPAIQEDYLGL
ncbi:MAG: ABC transporter ATP-binding protein [Devosia sp.]|nr:ABC transporter ATP-binding protein [Devosia sp.]